MALQFYFGRAGSGKSYALYKNLIDTSIKEQKSNFMAVVPEQYSLEAQKHIMDLHPNSGSLNIEVTSFKRLAFFVFEEQGYSNYRMMDELGQTLVMRKVLQECKNNLTIYSKKTNMPGFAEKMKTLISELKQYSIAVDDVSKIEKNMEDRPALKHKFHDIDVIYRAFEEYIGKKNITNEDVLDIFCDFIPKSDFVRNTYFYLDGYTGFTPIQYKVLELLIKYSKGLFIALTLPENEKTLNKYSKYELFCLSKETVCKLTEIANKNNIKIQEHIWVGKGKAPYRIRGNRELCFMEENIFRNNKKFEGKVSSVEVHFSGNPLCESENTVRAISKLVREEGYRYNDIAVITGNIEAYYRYLKEGFDRYGIPVFIDHKKDALDNPFIEAIKTAVEVVEKDFSYDSIFHLLKLNVLDFDMEQVDLFENYVLRSGRRGFKSYSIKWEKIYKGMYEHDIDVINQVREKVIDSLAELRKNLKDKNSTIRKFTIAIYQWIKKNNFYTKLENYIEYFETQGLMAKSNEYKQIYDAIIGIFDRIVELLGNEKVSVTEYKQILQSGFEGIRIGIIPPGLDTVMVGDIERTRLKDIKKIIFFLGVNDGIIPSAGVSGGIITDMDREYLSAQSVLLAPTARENVFKQKIYLYTLLAKPTQKIILSYSTSGPNNQVGRKSYLISAIEQMFPQLTEIDDDATSLTYADIVTKNMGLKYISENIKEIRFGREDEMTKNLLGVLGGKEVDMILEGAFFRKKTPVIDELIAKQLYGNKENIGITRIERYAMCAYSQFLKNGLKLGERKKFGIAAYDIGNLYHEAIDKYFNQIQKEGQNWEDLEIDVSRKIMDRCIEQVMDEYENDALEGSARNIFIKEQVRRTANKTAEVLMKHIQSGKFKPAEYELSVRHGRIDRVDTMETGDSLYVKVIDYKSGNKSFSFTDAFMGISMQLLVYLKDAMDYEQKKNPQKKVLPAGGLYFKIQDPFVKRPDFQKIIEEYKESNPDTNWSEEQIIRNAVENLKLSEYSMTGVVNSHRDIIESMDENVFQKSGKSGILPVTSTKSGIGKNSAVLEEKTFNKFLDYMMQKANDMTEEIMCGKAQINPVKEACIYCPYSSVCGFDTKLGYKYRDKESVDGAYLQKLFSENEVIGENDEMD